MKINLLILFLIVTINSGIAQTSGKNVTNMSTFHDFTMTTLEGEEFDMSQLKGKKVLVVNTASKCGLTPQYAQMEELYKKYGGDKFVILGFPANNFLKQEPGTDKEIAEFCTKNYGVTFPMFSKISVKGKDIHPLYSWLTQKELNGVEDAGIKWNFQKFMIDKDGKWVGIIGPRKSPLDEEIINWIENR